MRKAILTIAALTIAAPVFAEMESGTYNEAVTSSYAILAPASADYVRAKRELAAGNYADAAQQFERLADGSRDPAVSLLAGYANLGAGKLGRAEIYFTRSLGLDARSPYPRHGLGLVALARGDRAAALRELRQLETASQSCAATCAQATDIDRALRSLRNSVG